MGLFFERDIKVIPPRSHKFHALVSAGFVAVRNCAGQVPKIIAVSANPSGCAGQPDNRFWVFSVTEFGGKARPTP